jgi:hypothetical protein
VKSAVEGLRVDQRITGRSNRWRDIIRYRVTVSRVSQYGGMSSGLEKDSECVAR